MTNILHKSPWSAFKKLLLALTLLTLTGIALPEKAKADDHYGYYRRHGYHHYERGRHRHYRGRGYYHRHRRHYYRNGRRYYGYSGDPYYYGARPGVSVNVGL